MVWWRGELEATGGPLQRGYPVGCLWGCFSSTPTGTVTSQIPIKGLAGRKPDCISWLPGLENPDSVGKTWGREVWERWPTLFLYSTTASVYTEVASNGDPRSMGFDIYSVPWSWKSVWSHAGFCSKNIHEKIKGICAKLWISFTLHIVPQNGIGLVPEKSRSRVKQLLFQGKVCRW